MKFTHFVAPVMAVLLLTAFVTFPQKSFAAECDTVTVVSDTNTTSGGDPAVLISPISPYWTASIPGASWIWGNVPLDTTTNQTLTFTRTFYLESAPSSATLSVAADDLFTATVNGTEVSSNQESDPFMAVSTVNVAPQLVAGTNTITFAVTNLAFPKNDSPEENPAGLLYSLSAVPSCGSTSGSGTDGGSSGQIIYPHTTAPATTTPPAAPVVQNVETGLTNVSKGIAGLSAMTGVSGAITSTTGAVGSTSGAVLAKAVEQPLAADVVVFGKQLPFYFWAALVLLLLALALLANEAMFSGQKPK